MCNRVRKLVCRPIQTHRLKRFVESSTLIHPHHFDEFIYSDESTCFLSLFGWRLSQANRYGSNNAQYYRYEIVGEVPLSGCVGIVMTLYTFIHRSNVLVLNLPVFALTCGALVLVRISYVHNSCACSCFQSAKLSSSLCAHMQCFFFGMCVY